MPATIINAILTKEYGIEWLNWENDTIIAQVQNDFGELSPVNADKILAINIALTTELYYNFLESFEDINNAICDAFVDFEMSTPNEVEHMIWAMVEIAFNDEDDSTFSMDVKAYIDTILKKNGFAQYPKILGAIDKNLTGSFIESPVMNEDQITKHSRINAYCLTKFNEVNDLSKELFDVDLRPDFFSEFPLELFKISE